MLGPTRGPQEVRTNKSLSGADKHVTQQHTLDRAAVLSRGRGQNCPLQFCEKTDAGVL